MASNAQRIGGTLSLRVDGNTYEARGAFQTMPSAVKRTGVAGADGVHGYIEEPVVPMIKGDISIGNSLSVDILDGITDSTIQLALANGRTYVLTNAWYVAGTTIDAHDGKIPVQFEGLTCQEI
jgi:Phage tail tube protein